MNKKKLTLETHIQIRTFKEIKDTSVYMLKKLTGMGYSEAFRRYYEDYCFPLSFQDQDALTLIRELNRLAYQLPSCFDEIRKYIKELYHIINSGIRPVYAGDILKNVPIPAIEVKRNKYRHGSSRDDNETEVPDVYILAQIMIIIIYQRHISSGIEAVAFHLEKANFLRFWEKNQDQILNIYKYLIENNKYPIDIAVYPSRYNIRWKRFTQWPSQIYFREFLETILEIDSVCDIKTLKCLKSDILKLNTLVEEYLTYKSLENRTYDDVRAMDKKLSQFKFDSYIEDRISLFRPMKR